MTWPEVASDALKIGVPSLLTGFIAFVIARASRAHEFEKERRRRRQDLIERSLDGFEKAHSKFEILSSIYFAFCQRSPEDLGEDDEFWARMRSSLERARDELETLHTIQGRFKMLRLEDSAAAIAVYREAARIMVFSVSFKGEPSASKPDFEVAKQSWESQREMVEAKIAADYSEL